jgi:hypothetical protein
MEVHDTRAAESDEAIDNTHEGGERSECDLDLRRRNSEFLIVILTVSSEQSAFLILTCRVSSDE